MMSRTCARWSILGIWIYGTNHRLRQIRFGILPTARLAGRVPTTTRGESNIPVNRPPWPVLLREYYPGLGVSPLWRQYSLPTHMVCPRSNEHKTIIVGYVIRE